MTSMCNALEGRVESSSQPDDIDFDVQREMERQAEEKLERDAIAEIDRYRRMDEWSTSYQNIYTRTAIRCQLRLHRAKLIDVDAMHFLQYTRPGTYDKLRLEAFECLVELDLFRNPNLLRWFIYNMSADPSPWMRSQLHRLFGRALAPVAFGTDQAPEQPVQTDGLIIEQESTTDVRRADLARKQTVPGALAALKEELKDNETLQECLWAAANSSYLGPLEVLEFVDLCRILYDSKSSLLVQLKYPRYWKAEHLGNVSSSLPIPSFQVLAPLTSNSSGKNALLPLRPPPYISPPYQGRHRCCCGQQAQTRRAGHAAAGTADHLQIL